MTDNNNGNASENISWFPYVLVVTAILVIGVVVLSMNSKPQPSGSTAATTPAAAAHKQAKTSNVLFRLTSDASAKEISAKLPHSFGSKPNALFYYKLDLDYAANGPTVFNILVDDCIEKLVVNDKAVEITGAENKKNRCVWNRGVDVDLKSVLKEGANKVYIEGKNLGGPGGIEIRVK